MLDRPWKNVRIWGACDFLRPILDFKIFWGTGQLFCFPLILQQLLFRVFTRCMGCVPLWRPLTLSWPPYPPSIHLSTCSLGHRPPRRGRFIKREQPIRKSSRGGCWFPGAYIMWSKKVLHFEMASCKHLKMHGNQSPYDFDLSSVLFMMHKIHPRVLNLLIIATVAFSERSNFLKWETTPIHTWQLQSL